MASYIMQRLVNTRKKLPWRQLSSSACNSCSLLDGVQYFSLVMVLFQHFESGPSDLKALNYKSSSLYYLNVWTMKWMTVRRLQRPQSDSLNSDWKQSSCIASLLCTREKSVFTCLCSRWRVLAHLSSNQRPSLYGNNPLCPHTHTDTHTLATSLLITIEIVIDLSYLSPGAIRSHLLSVPYWKGKHSWCYRLNECPAPGCSADTMRLALSSMMDGANSFTTASQLLNSGRCKLFLFLF